MAVIDPHPNCPPAAAYYAGQCVALLTQHGKEQVIAPLLDSALGCRVERVAGYDTDLLGTFTREIPREGTQREAARRKARIGMQLAGASFGLASEGAFGADPFMGLLPWNMELLIFIDDVRELEIAGTAHGRANFAHLLTSDWAAAEAFARKIDFPRHHLVVRPESEDDTRLNKGINTWEQLETAFASARRESANGVVFLESDVRAHANPTRMENIRLAAEDLLRKLNSFCPACGMPGFGCVERLPGLPCADCHAPTREIRAEVHGCVKCTHCVTHEQTDLPYAEPGRCDYCNP